MIVKPATVEDVRAVLFDPWVWDRETDDRSPPRDAIGAMPAEVECLGGYVNGAIIGLFITHPFRDGDKLHFMVLRQFREHARAFLMAAIATVRRKLYCQIAECYMPVINFAKKHGFVEIERGGEFVKNGHIYQRRTLCHS